MSWEQISNAITFYAHYIESKVGKTGLTVTVDVWRVLAGSATEVVTGGSATEMGDGLYLYTLASGSVTGEGEYVAVFKTATATVDAQHIPALWVVGRAGVENLDATLSSRSSHTAADVWASATRTLTSFGTLVSDIWAAGTRTLTSISALAAQIASAVLDAVAATYNTAGTIGEAINNAGSATDPLTSQVPGAYAQGTAGHALGRIGTASVDVTNPVAENGDVSLIQSDDYDDEDTRALDFAMASGSSGWPADLTDGDVEMNVYDEDDVELGSFEGSVVTPTGSGRKVRVELTGANVASLPTGRFRHDVEITIDGRKSTLVRGLVTVSAD